MISLHVEKLREGSGRPIVLLHGWLGTHHDWEGVLGSTAFALEDRPVLAIDLPAHGESEDFDGRWGFEEASEAVLVAVSKVVHTAKGESIDLVGYSMGGRLALYIAATRAHRIHRLALIGAHPGYEHPRDRRDRRDLDDQRATDLLDQPEPFLEDWAYLGLFGPHASDAWKAVLRRRREHADERAFGWSRALIALTTGDQPSLWMVPLAAEIPTLYMVGARDEKYVEFARVFNELNGDQVDVALIVNAHHAAHLDRPDAVAQRIGDFLR